MRIEIDLTISESEIESIGESRTGRREIHLREPREGVEWGHIYKILLEGENETIYGFFGYRRDRIIEC